MITTALIILAVTIFCLFVFLVFLEDGAHSGITEDTLKKTIQITMNVLIGTVIAFILLLLKIVVIALIS